jgi:hypothetical protein
MRWMEHSSGPAPCHAGLHRADVPGPHPLLPPAAPGAAAARRRRRPGRRQRPRRAAGLGRAAGAAQVAGADGGPAGGAHLPAPHVSGCAVPAGGTYLPAPHVSGWAVSAGSACVQQCCCRLRQSCSRLCWLHICNSIAVVNVSGINCSFGLFLRASISSYVAKLAPWRTECKQRLQNDHRLHYAGTLQISGCWSPEEGACPGRFRCQQKIILFLRCKHIAPACCTAS